MKRGIAQVGQARGGEHGHEAIGFADQHLQGQAGSAWQGYQEGVESAKLAVTREYVCAEVQQQRSAQVETE
jgi:hypothetical protein